MLQSNWLTLFLVLPLLLPTYQKLSSSRSSVPLPSSSPSSTSLPTSSSSSLSSQEPGSSVLQITKSNFNTTLHSHDLIFINFYADWCHFSAQLSPIFEEAAIRLAEELPKLSKVRLGRVDCVREMELSNICAISKFPTLRLYSRGHPLRREYRGKRSVDAIVAYVLKQYKTGLHLFNEIKQLDMIDVKRRSIIGFFANRKLPALASFELLAERYKNDCDFYLRVGAKLDNVTYTQLMPNVVFRPDIARTHAQDELFGGNIGDQMQLETWLINKCVPLVREVNFNNVEEIIEQGLPLLVLFHNPQDVTSVKDFKSIVEMQLAACVDCGRFNFCTVDGIKFEHSVRNMGKTRQDLPIIAIDSLRFMHQYPKFKDMYIPGHLKLFIQDFSSHQLKHKLNPETNEEKQTQPPLSTFKELGPSKHRYTLVGHDEL